MSIDLLAAEWEELLGDEGKELLFNQLTAIEEQNILETHANKKGLDGPCRYTLSSALRGCGLFSGQNDNFTPVLYEVTQRVTKALRAAKIKNQKHDVFIGLSPYQFFGAEVTQAQNGYIVLISPITFSLCFLFSILAVTSAQASVRFGDSRNIVGEVISGTEWAYQSHQALTSSIHEYVTSGTILDPGSKVDFARFDILSWHYIERVQRTYEHMLDFLILHEFGHIALGHMEKMGTCLRAIPSTSISYAAGTPAPKQEEAADDFALGCLLGSKCTKEAKRIYKLLEKGNTNDPKLNDLWCGRTSIGRYSSALYLLKIFDLFDYYQNTPERYTDLCEIDGTHPSGQHRFIRAFFGSSSNLLTMPVDHMFNRKPLLTWQNLASLISTKRSPEEIIKISEKHGLAEIYAH